MLNGQTILVVGYGSRLSNGNLYIHPPSIARSNMSIKQAAVNVLKILLDEADKRDYDPPVSLEVIEELEYIIVNS